MLSNLNLVKTTVSVAGNEVSFVRLKLFQKFNTHHRCEIEIDYEEFGKEKWMGDPIKFINYIGKDINIIFTHRNTGEENLFAGIVTNVTFSGYHGSRNSIIVTGASPTIKLDGKPAMDSFMDLPLQIIVQEAVGNSGNGGSVISNPKFASKLDYICQYNESCWEFLNRLSWQFGEWLFYNGQNCYFGMKLGDTATLEYDKEMTHFDLSANLVPQKFNRRQFLKHDSKEIDTDDPTSVSGVHGYLQASKNRSESIYTSEVTTPLMPDVNTKKDLNDLVMAEKSRAVGEMLVMRGETQTCKVKIGDSVKIQLPDYMEVLTSVDRFLVTQVTHTVDQEGHYSNSFEGIIDEIEAIPMTEPKMPTAMPQIATVRENVDPGERGLVKVQTGWQKKKNKTTNWIRVQTPDAGASGTFPKNRGQVFIPEIGDQVMIGFEFGDSSRPYVMGSMFPENKSEGGKKNNNLKSIKTRSGHAIIFNDDISGSWGITIKDDRGDIIQISTKEKNISIHAPENLIMTAKNILISAEENVKINAGNDIMENAGKNMSESAGEAYTLQTKNKNTIVQENTYTDIKRNAVISVGKDATIVADNNVKVSGSKLNVSAIDADLLVDARGKITLKSGDIVDIAQG